LGLGEGRKEDDERSIMSQISYAQWNRSLGMVRRVLNVGVFLYDDLYMSNARVTYVCEYLLFSTYILIFI